MQNLFADSLAVKIGLSEEAKGLVEVYLGISSDGGHYARILLNEKNAKELSLMLRRALKERERGFGKEIPLTEAEWRRIGVAQEDW